MQSSSSGSIRESGIVRDLNPSRNVPRIPDIYNNGQYPSNHMQAIHAQLFVGGPREMEHEHHRSASNSPAGSPGPQRRPDPPIVEYMPPAGMDPRNYGNIRENLASAESLSSSRRFAASPEAARHMGILQAGQNPYAENVMGLQPYPNASASKSQTTFPSSRSNLSLDEKKGANGSRTGTALVVDRGISMG